MKLYEFVNLIEDCRDEQSFLSVIETFLTSYGFEYYSYYIIRADIEEDNDFIHVTGTFPQDWKNHYISNNLLKIDPIQKLAFFAKKPFCWRDISKNFPVSPTGQNYLADLFDAGFDGVTYPIPGPHNTNASLGFATRYKQCPQLSEHDNIMIRHICQHMHETYLERFFISNAPPSLSKRECEVLFWAAKGKSNHVIANILGISTHTVDTIFRRCYSKLKTNDRISAVIKALHLDLIKPQKTETL